jgi:hypothetical protein
LLRVRCDLREGCIAWITSTHAGQAYREKDGEEGDGDFLAGKEGKERDKITENSFWMGRPGRSVSHHEQRLCSSASTHSLGSKNNDD